MEEYKNEEIIPLENDILHSMNKSLLDIEDVKLEDLDPKNFESIKVYSEDDHFMRRLIKYKPTEELFFYEFNEEVDYVNGNDPQYRTYILVKDEQEADEINKLDFLQILKITPRLIDDWRADDTRTTKWIR